MDFTIIALGFVLLVFSADKFILGASQLARHMGMPPLVVGLTFVAMGTSFPELLVSAMAALEGSPGIAIGNALGSNITNIGLVIGVTAILIPISVHSTLLKREFPILFIIMALVGVMFYFRQLYRFEGVLLLLGLVGYVYWIVRQGLKQSKQEPLQAEFTRELKKPVLTRLKATLWFLVGLICLLISARMIVLSAVSIAQAFGVSDLIIGLTIVAIGTSLPEFVASVVSVFKKEHEIALGNVMGSNIFNLLGVLGLPILIQPTYLNIEIFRRDYAIMLALTVALFLTAYGFRGPGKIYRWEGCILVVLYAGYLGLLWITR